MHFEIRLGDAAFSRAMPSSCATKMIRVNKDNGQTQIVEVIPTLFPAGTKASLLLKPQDFAATELSLSPDAAEHILGRVELANAYRKPYDTKMPKKHVRFFCKRGAGPDGSGSSWAVQALPDPRLKATAYVQRLVGAMPVPDAPDSIGLCEGDELSFRKDGETYPMSVAFLRDYSAGPPAAPLEEPAPQPAAPPSYDAPPSFESAPTTPPAYDAPPSYEQPEMAEPEPEQAYAAVPGEQAYAPAPAKPRKSSLDYGIGKRHFTTAELHSIFERVLKDAQLARMEFQDQGLSGKEFFAAMFKDPDLASLFGMFPLEEDEDQVNHPDVTALIFRAGRFFQGMDIDGNDSVYIEEFVRFAAHGVPGDEEASWKSRTDQPKLGIPPGGVGAKPEGDLHVANKQALERVKAESGTDTEMMLCYPTGKTKHRRHFWVEEANASEKLERTSSGRMLSNVLCWSKEGKNETGGLFGRAHIKREKLVLVQDIAPTVAYKNGRDRAFCLATPSTMLVLVADDVETKKQWVLGCQLMMEDEKVLLLQQQMKRLQDEVEGAEDMIGKAQAAHDEAQRAEAQAKLDAERAKQEAEQRAQREIDQAEAAAQQATAEKKAELEAEAKRVRANAEAVKKKAQEDAEAAQARAKAAAEKARVDAEKEMRRAQEEAQRLIEEGGGKDLQLTEPRECVVCFGDFLGFRDGVECNAEGFKHFTCKDCFQMHVAASCTDELRKQELRHGMIYCPYCVFPPTSSSCDSAPFKAVEIASFVDAATFKLFQDAKGKLIEARLAKQAEAMFEKRLESELEKVKEMGKEVFEARKHILVSPTAAWLWLRKVVVRLERRKLSCCVRDGPQEEILMLKCPRCSQAFIDFTGCMALTCSQAGCGCGFCGWCLADCGSDAHAHVRTCKARPPNHRSTYFAEKSEYEAIWKKRRIQLLEAHLSKYDWNIQEKVLENVHIELANVELGDWAKAYNPKRKKKAAPVPRQLVDFGFIENSTTGHVFEVQAAQAGASVVMYSKHGDGTQMFKLAPVKGTDFSHIESGAAAGLVLECQDRRGNRGTELVLAKRANRANYQHFKPVPVPGKQDTYYLESHMGRVRRRHGRASFAELGRTVAATQC